MADYVKAPTLYKRVQFTGDESAFLADLQANTNAWWNWAVYGTDTGDAVAVRYNSNSQPNGFLEVYPDQFVVFRDGPDEVPYVDASGSSVVPA